jgi:hypothetical protein
LGVPTCIVEQQRLCAYREMPVEPEKSLRTRINMDLLTAAISCLGAGERVS